MALVSVAPSAARRVSSSRFSHSRPKENNANADATATHRRKLPGCVSREGDDSRAVRTYTHTYTRTYARTGSARKSERGRYRRGSRLVGWLQRGAGEKDGEEVWRDVLSVNPNPRPFLPLHRSLYLALLRRAVASGRGRLPRTLDFKRYPFSFYYLPSSSARGSAMRCDATLVESGRYPVVPSLDPGANWGGLID